MKLEFVLTILVSTSAILAKPQAAGFFPSDDDTEEIQSATKPSLTFPGASSQSHDHDHDAETIDAIVSATREGRQLNLTDERFNQILSDPTLKEKLAAGSEVEARGFIHDKLCQIGLCDGNYDVNGGYGHHGLNVKNVQLVQPVAVKPIGGPIPAIPLEPQHKPYGHGRPRPYGNRPGIGPGPNYGPGPGNYGPGSDFGGAVGGQIFPQPGAPQIYPQSNPSFGPAPFRPNYGGRSPILPPVKASNTHVHHHIHHNQPDDNGPMLDGYYGAAQKSSVSLATPSGKALGMHPVAQTLSPSYAKKCVCVPAETCYIESSGTQQQAQIVQGVGIPNNGFVGYGIDPRNLKASHGHGIESNSTDVGVDVESATFETPSEFPESPEIPSRKRRDQGGLEGGLIESQPRQLNYGQNGRGDGNCQPGLVCCASRHPSQSQYQLPSSSNNNMVDYGRGRFSTPQQQQQYGQCGHRQTDGINGRVISGGNAGSSLHVDGETSFGDYPWHVAILQSGGFVCSGSLIDSFHILTAAHCIQKNKVSAAQLKIRLGEYDVNHETEFYPHVDVQVESILAHPDYYAGNLVNDVAILRLASSIDFPSQPHISPICLPPPNLDFTGRRCFVSGWGKDAFGSQGKFQNVLKEVDLPILSHFDCEQKLKRTKLGHDFSLDRGFVCAGGEPLKDACKGDGGGGLVCEVQGNWYLAGVVSWGVGCGEVDVPGVYVKVSQYSQWIQQYTGIHH